MVSVSCGFKPPLVVSLSGQDARVVTVLTERPASFVKRLLCKPYIYESYSILCRYITAIVNVEAIGQRGHTPCCLKKGERAREERRGEEVGELHELELLRASGRGDEHELTRGDMTRTHHHAEQRCYLNTVCEDVK